MSDFLLSFSPQELLDEVGSLSIKRAMWKAIEHLNGYCRDERYFEQNLIPKQDEDVLKRISEIMREEGEDIHDYAGVKLQFVDAYEVRILFRTYDFGVD